MGKFARASRFTLEFSGDGDKKQKILQGMTLVEDYMQIISGKTATNTMVKEYLLDMWQSQGLQYEVDRSKSYTVCDMNSITDPLLLTSKTAILNLVSQVNDHQQC